MRIGIGTGVNKMSGGGLVYEPESLTYFAAFSVEPSTARKIIINTLILSLKNGGIWSKLDALWLLANTASQSALLNVITPGTYTATEVNSPTFTADQGYTGNASNMYLNTNYQYNTNGVQYTLNSACHFVYNRVDVLGAYCAAGINITGVNYFFIRRATYGYNASTNEDAALNGSVANANATGFYCANRSDATNCQLYKNGSNVLSYVKAASAIPAGKDFILALNLAGSPALASPYQISVRGIGASLNSSEQTALYNAIQAYMTSLGTQV